jgi:hypothetical protein
MNRRRPALIRSHRVELTLGVALFVASTWLIWDAYEGRGRRRPFPARFLP